MQRRTYRIIFWLLAALALGVQIIWLLIMLEMKTRFPMVAIVALVFFPGAMGWIMPAGFAWLWRDEIEKPSQETEPN